MKALVVEKEGAVTDNLKLTEVDKPKLMSQDLLVKIYCASLNPADWKMAKSGILVNNYPYVLGCDMSGIVEEIGSGVSGFNKGDAVYGFTHIGTSGAGTFAEYCIIPSTMAAKKPENLSFEQAAAIPVCAITSFLALFYALKFPLPDVSPPPQKESILVWGASSSVGQCVVQLAKCIGLHVIGVCSKHNHEVLSKEFGADCLVDYKDEDVVKRVLSETGGKLRFAVDCIGPDTANLCLQCLSSTEPSYLATIAGGPSATIPENVKHEIVNAALSWNEPEHMDFLHKHCIPLLEKGRIKPNRIQILEGLENIPKGLEMLSQNKVSGSKFVVRIASPMAAVSE